MINYFVKKRELIKKVFFLLDLLVMCCFFGGYIRLFV